MRSVSIGFWFLWCLCLVVPAPLSAQSGWTALNSGAVSNLHAVHFKNVDTGFVVGAEGTILKTTNAGSNWQNVSPPALPVALNGVHVFDSFAGRVVVVGDGGLILLSTNGGTTWAPESSGVSDDLLSVSFSSPVGVSGGRSQTIVRSTNDADSWSVVQSGFFGGGFWGVSMLSPQIGFVCGENSIFQPLLGKTTNGGVSWAFTPFYLDNNEGRAYGVEFTDVQRGHVAAGVWDGRGATVRTTDGGATWVALFVPAPLYSVDFPASATGFIGYMVGAAGRIVKTSDGGNSWQAQATGTSATLRGVHFLDPDNGYVVGDGGVILKTTTGGEPGVGVADKQGWETSELLLNYPNPFNPVTTIEFRIPSAGHVSLKVYDLVSREVATLVEEELRPGIHEAEWDATALASGIYFCRMKAGAFVQTIKMVLVR